GTFFLESCLQSCHLVSGEFGCRKYSRPCTSRHLRLNFTFRDNALSSIWLFERTPFQWSSQWIRLSYANAFTHEWKCWFTGAWCSGLAASFHTRERFLARYLSRVALGNTWWYLGKRSR